MDDTNLKNIRKEHAALAPLWTKGRDLFSGTEAVVAGRTKYLHKAPNETDDDYEARLKCAVLDPFVEKIITARMAVLFRKDAERKLPDAIKHLKHDADRQGTPASAFFRHACAQAQIVGLHWVAVDMPAAPEGGYKSKAAADAVGHRVFFEHVPAEAVLDWEVGPDRKLLWAVIEMTPKAEREPGQKEKEGKKWKVWHRDRWEVWAENSDSNAKEKFVLEDEGPNTSGRVNLIPFLGEAVTAFTGKPVAHRVFPHIISIYNKISDRDWFEFLTAHPVPYSISPEKMEVFDTGKGIWMKSEPGHQVDIGYLEPTGASFDASDVSVNNLKHSILSIALAQSRKDSAQVQGADSQKEDRRFFTSSLMDTSRNAEASEIQSYETALAFMKGTGKILVEYSRDFDDQLIEGKMVQELRGLRTDGILTRKKVLETLVASEFVEVEDIEKELAEAKAEADEESIKIAETAIRNLEQQATQNDEEVE